MKRLGVVAATVFGLLALLLLGFSSLAMLAGVGSGAFFYMIGQGSNVTDDPRFDRNSRLGAALFASGLGAGAFGSHQPFPEGFRLFCLCGTVIGCCAAVGLAIPKRKA